ncbi:MAG: hypothetical protein ABIO05_08610 [Ferruginibacter sp.]
MNFKILLFAVSAAAIASCSTAYKSGQTPDDVYFSPAKKVVEKTGKQQDEEEYVSNESIEEREMRMRIRDRRWRDLNNDVSCNCSCDYTPYKYGANYGYYYNPYYYRYPVYTNSPVYVNPAKAPLRTANLGGYTAIPGTRSNNTKYSGSQPGSNGSTYNNTNSTNGKVYTPSNNRTYSPPANSTQNSSTNSNNRSSSGQSVSRPARHN